MIDVTIVGAGDAARACNAILSHGGFQVEHAADLEAGDHSPVILGESPAAFALARQAVESGRHLLIASPTSLPSERLSLLFAGRRPAQALFLWSERRYHPAHRFVNSLIEADATWRPRYLRQQTLSLEQPAGGLVRWRTLESVALLNSITSDVPESVWATATTNPLRNTADVISMRIAFQGLEALVQVALGEAVERREMLVAAATRKAYVDELNASMPVRLVEDDSRPQGRNQTRWLSCPSPNAEELARQQCLSFLDGTFKSHQAQDEADIWERALAILEAMDRSLQTNGAQAELARSGETPKLHLIFGEHAVPMPPSVA